MPPRRTLRGQHALATRRITSYAKRGPTAAKSYRDAAKALTRTTRRPR